jgi:hypothetical protein
MIMINYFKNGFAFENQMIIIPVHDRLAVEQHQQLQHRHYADDMNDHSQQTLYTSDTPYQSDDDDETDTEEDSFIDSDHSYQPHLHHRHHRYHPLYRYQQNPSSSSSLPSQSQSQLVPSQQPLLATTTNTTTTTTTATTSRKSSSPHLATFLDYSGSDHARSHFRHYTLYQPSYYVGLMSMVAERNDLPALTVTEKVYRDVGIREKRLLPKY